MKDYNLVSIVLLSLSVLASSDNSQNYTHHTEDQTRNSSRTPLSSYFTRDYVDQGYVTGGSLLSFDNTLSGQEKTDVMNSILYAQQIANDKYDRTKDFTKWYTTFSDMLRKTTWNFESASFVKYDSKQTQYQLTGATYALLAPTCAKTQKEILNRLLTVWKTLQDFDKRVTTFLTRSGSGTSETNAANFQIMPAIRGEPGQVLLVYGGFYYQAQSTVERYFTYLWPSQSISLYYSVVVAKFRTSNYKKIRSLVKATLGDRAQSLVHEIDI